MQYFLFVPALFLTFAVPFAIFHKGERTHKRFVRSLAFNIVSFFAVLFTAVLFVFGSNVFASEIAAEAAGTGAVSTEGLKAIAAALSTGLGSIGTGIAVAASASSAIGAISENEKLFGKVIVFVGLSEGIAIFGFLISLLILFL